MKPYSIGAPAAAWGRQFDPRGIHSTEPAATEGTAVTSKDREWVWVAVILSGVSVFAQINPLLDLVITLIYLSCALRLFRREDFVVIYAVLAVFAPRLYLYNGGVSLATVLLLLYLARIIVPFRRHHIALPPLTIPVKVTLFMFALHGVLVIFPARGSLAFLNYAAICVLIGSLTSRLRDPELLKKFMISLMIAALGACMYGVVNPGALHSNSSEIGVGAGARFTGVLSDPNYMGLILVLGVIGAQLLPRRMFVVRVLCSLILLVFIIETGSLTALFALVLGAALFLASSRGQAGTVRFSVVAIFVLMASTSWGAISAWLTSSSALGFLANRVADEGVRLGEDDYLSVGSGRVEIAQEYLSYFWSQDVYGLVFGGNLVGAYGVGDSVAKELGSAAMPHNFQIELLMTVGILGWMTVTLAAVMAFVGTVSLMWRTQDGAYRMLAITKAVLFLYSFSLSMFPSWWFLALYLLSPARHFVSQRRAAESGTGPE